MHAGEHAATTAHELREFPPIKDVTIDSCSFVKLDSLDFIDRRKRPGIYPYRMKMGINHKNILTDWSGQLQCELCPQPPAHQNQNATI